MICYWMNIQGKEKNVCWEKKKNSYLTLIQWAIREPKDSSKNCEVTDMTTPSVFQPMYPELPADPSRRNYVHYYLILLILSQNTFSQNVY